MKSKVSKPDQVKKVLLNEIRNICSNPSEFVEKPNRDFSRNRKMPLEKVLKFTLSLEGCSTTNELLEFYDVSKDTPSLSACIQQRNKLAPEAFEELFHRFNNATNNDLLFHGYRLFAIDGSEVPIPMNPDDESSFYPGTNGQKPYNLLHLNALYDLLDNTYVDVLIQGSHVMNEPAALCSMVDRSSIKSAIVIGDRNYATFNNMAHCVEHSCKFLFRVKDIYSKTSILQKMSLPSEASFDMDCDLNLFRRLTKQGLEWMKDKDNYRYIPSNSTFDFLPAHYEYSRNRPIPTYRLAFRAVRFAISETEYETVLTNLDREAFPSEVIKELYSMRWGIETSFRQLKYTVGLLKFHSKKARLVRQEIYACLIMYNFSDRIVASTVIEKVDRKHSYKVNF